MIRFSTQTFPTMPSPVALAVPNFFAAVRLMLPPTRPRSELHGPWERYVNGQLYDVIAVPSSQRPLGFYRLKRNALLPRLVHGPRAFLHFDAVNYHSRAFANGTDLGALGPYVPYEFEVTHALREGNNTFEVSIADLRPEPGGSGKDEIELGVSSGWEAYSGIVRDVYVEYRRATFIENIRFGYTLKGGYAKAPCSTRVFLNSAAPSGANIEISLLRGDAVVARTKKDVTPAAGPSEVEINFDVDAPVLWSP